MAIAMQYAPASHGAVVLAVLPLLTAMGGALVAGERPSLGFWACGVAGNGAVLVYSLLLGGGPAICTGPTCCSPAPPSRAAMAYALGGEMARRIGGWEVISWALVFSAPAMLVLLVLLPGRSTGAPGPWAWAGFLYVSVFSMFLGFFAWNKGMAMGGIARIGQIQLLQPFVALAAASAAAGRERRLAGDRLCRAGGRHRGAGLAHAGRAARLRQALPPQAPQLRGRDRSNRPRQRRH